MAGQETNHSKCVRTRFNAIDDLILLKQVLGTNPYENGWGEVSKEVVKATKKPFTSKCVREHTSYLLKLFNKQDLRNLRRSGTEEEYKEKEELLQQVKDLQRETTESFARKQLTMKEDRRKGAEAREGAALNDGVTESEEALDVLQVGAEGNQCEVLLEVDEGAITSTAGSSTTYDEERPPMMIVQDGGTSGCRKRVKGEGNAYLKFLKEKHARASAREDETLKLEKEKIQLEKEKLLIEKRKMDLEKDKMEMEKDKVEMEKAREKERLTLEWERFQLEKREREAKLEMDREEHLQRIERERQQQRIIDLLLKRSDIN